MFLKELTYLAVPKGRGIQIPGDGMARTPVSKGLGTYVEGHLDSIAGVVESAAHLGKVPVLAQVSAAPLRVCLKTSCRQYNGAGIDLVGTCGPTYLNVVNPAIVVRQQAYRL